MIEGVARGYEFERWAACVARISRIFFDCKMRKIGVQFYRLCRCAVAMALRLRTISWHKEETFALLTQCTELDVWKWICVAVHIA